MCPGDLESWAELGGGHHPPWPIPPPAGEALPKARSQHGLTWSWGWGFPGGKEAEPRAQISGHLQAQDAKPQGRKPTRPEHSHTEYKSCFAPNFNLFPQASTPGALFYLSLFFFFFLPLIFHPRCSHQKQLHAKRRMDFYQENSFVSGTWAGLN